MQSLEDFRFYFTEEKEIDAFVSEAKELDGPPRRLQIARVRRAWSAVMQYGLSRKQTPSTAVERGDLLEDATLRDIVVSFCPKSSQQQFNQVAVANRGFNTTWRRQTYLLCKEMLHSVIEISLEKDFTKCNMPDVVLRLVELQEVF